MPQSDPERLVDPTARLGREEPPADRPERRDPHADRPDPRDAHTDRPEPQDPRPARSPSDAGPSGAGPSAGPRAARHTGAWWVLGIGVILLIAGVVLPDGLLIAAGLVLTGIAAQLLDPDRRPPGHAHHRTPH